MDEVGDLILVDELPNRSGFVTDHESPPYPHVRGFASVSRSPEGDHPIEYCVGDLGYGPMFDLCSLSHDLQCFIEAAAGLGRHNTLSLGESGNHVECRAVFHGENMPDLRAR